MEVVSVTSYFYSEDQVKPCGGEASLEYIRDVAQEAAEYLSANRDQLGPQSYLEVLKRFSMWAQGADRELTAGPLDRNEEDAKRRQSSSDEADVRQLDEKITQAMANMDYPQQWKNTDSQPREGNDLGSESVCQSLLSCRLLFARGKFAATPVTCLSVMASDTSKAQMSLHIELYESFKLQKPNQSKPNKAHSGNLYLCGFISVAQRSSGCFRNSQFVLHYFLEHPGQLSGIPLHSADKRKLLG